MNINERKSTGILYHFIDMKKLSFLIDNNFNFKFKKDDLGIKEDKYYLSTTRKFDFEWNPVRIVLDGTLISDNYEIIPVHFNNKLSLHQFKWLKKRSKNPEDIKIPKDFRNLDPKRKNLKHFDNQYEERIYSKKEWNDLSKFILQIDILENIISDNSYLYLKNQMKKLNISVNIVSKFKPYKINNFKYLKTFKNYKL